MMLPFDLPPELASLVRNTRCAEIATIGESGATVYRLLDAAGAVRFLKIIENDSEGELAHEAERTAWLEGKLPVPCVLFHDTVGSHSYLLTSGLPGIDAATLVVQHAADSARVARLLAHSLRRIHEVPTDDCPFDHTLPQMLAWARGRVERGEVDEHDFDPERQGRPAAALLQELLASQPADADWVFTHGDYCLPNILIEGDTVTGFIDLGRAGIGDRYRDLALCRRSLIRNCGPDAVPIFFDAYGLAPLDEEKLTYYQMLDELF